MMTYYAAYDIGTLIYSDGSKAKVLLHGEAFDGLEFIELSLRAEFRPTQRLLLMAPFETSPYVEK